MPKPKWAQTTANSPQPDQTPPNKPKQQGGRIVIFQSLGGRDGLFSAPEAETGAGETAIYAGNAQLVGHAGWSSDFPEIHKLIVA